MSQATITIKYKDPPKEGKKMWTISDGTQRFYVQPSDAEKYEKGSTYIVDYKSNEFKGHTFHNVVSGRLADGQLASANGHPIVKAGNGNGDIDIRSIFGLMHSYNGKIPSVPQMVQDLRNAEAALQAFENGDTFFSDSLEGTFDR